MLHEGAALILVTADDVDSLVHLLSESDAPPPRPALVLAGEDVAGDLATVTGEVPLIRIPADRHEREAFEWSRVASSVTATTLLAVTAAELTGGPGAPELPTGTPTGRSGDPVLANTASVPPWLAAAYVRHVLSSTSDATTIAHAGLLALRSARRSVEAIDPAGSHLDITARIGLPGGLQIEAPWRFRVGLRTSDHTLWSSPVRLERRTSWNGRDLWDRITVRIPLDRAVTGTYDVVVDQPDGQEYALRPSLGALSGSRVLTTATAGRTQRIRYLPSASGRGRVLHLEVHRSTAPWAGLAWRWRRLVDDVAFIARGRGGRRARFLVLVRLLTRPLFAGRHVWLVGERRDTAHDNGFHLFVHLRKTAPRRSVYYVIDQDSPQYLQLRQLGHVIAHSSWRHQLYMLHADVLANAFALPHLTPRSWVRREYINHLVWRIGALRVFLQHGVHVSPTAVQRLTTGYDVFVTSMDRETQALRETSGYDAQLVETGLPRYDNLSPTPPSRMIFFMTTWRRYLPSRVLTDDKLPTDDYVGSQYERFTTGLLHSERLQRLLEEHDYTLMFLPHYNLAERFAGMRTAGDRIHIGEAQNDEIQHLVRTCDVFITDYSSVHFDAAYTGTPIIYSRFDRHEFEARHAAPSWFDFERDGFGPVAETLEDTLDELEELLRDGAPLAPVYAARAAAFFPHRDQQNSARVVAAIDDALSRRRPG